MADAIYILLTLICFGIGHAYIKACNRLNVKAKANRD
jgi:hypothetical protein